MGRSGLFINVHDKVLVLGFLGERQNEQAKGKFEEISKNLGGFFVIEFK